jgi:hypothetical protein
MFTLTIIFKLEIFLLMVVIPAKTSFKKYILYIYILLYLREHVVTLMLLPTENFKPLKLFLYFFEHIIMYSGWMTECVSVKLLYCRLCDCRGFWLFMLFVL